MNDPIVVTIEFGRPRRGREILDMVRRVMDDKRESITGMVTETMVTDHDTFRVGQSSRIECDNIMVAPDMEGDWFFDRCTRYSKVVVTHRVWDEKRVVRQDYPFNTTEDQLIAGVNRFAKELVMDDADVVITEVAFRYKTSAPASI